jgi:two-component system LytT family sensor kinase
VNFHVDDFAAAVPIPAKTIQPLVENAVKHGVSAVARSGLLQVRATVDAERLCIAVHDNGPGFPEGFLAGANGHGLRNVMERISGYYGDSATLACDNAADGACVRLELPVLVRHDAYSDRRR